MMAHNTLEGRLRRAAIEYLNNRGVTDENIKEFRLALCTELGHRTMGTYSSRHWGSGVGSLPSGPRGASFRTRSRKAFMQVASTRGFRRSRS